MADCVVGRGEPHCNVGDDHVAYRTEQTLTYTYGNPVDGHGVGVGVRLRSSFVSEEIGDRNVAGLLIQDWGGCSVLHGWSFRCGEPFSPSGEKLTLVCPLVADGTLSMT